MVSVRHREPRPPWYLRGRSLVIGVGALATAVLAVVALWDRFNEPDPADVASFTSAAVTKRVSLATFTGTGTGTDLSLNPASGAAGAPGALMLVAQTQEATTSPTPTSTGTPTPTPTTTTGTPTPTPTPTTTTGSPPTSGPPGLKNWPPTAEYAGSVADTAALDDYQVPPSSIPILLPPEAIDDEGNPLPAEEVAEQLADALEQVESQGGDGKKDPMGFVVAVNLDVVGLKQVPLLLTWSLDGLDVPVSWAAGNIAYRMTATTAHDSGSADVWVPDLKGTGTYNVNLTLAREKDGAVLARSEPVQLTDP